MGVSCFIVYATQEKLNLHKKLILSAEVRETCFTVTPLADEENKKMSIRKYAPLSSSSALSGIVTKFEIKSHYERKGIRVGVIKMPVSGPIRTTGDHVIDIDGFPITISVEGYR